MVTFEQLWTICSTGKGEIGGIDGISMPAVFRLAEMKLYGDDASAKRWREGFLEGESRVKGRPISPELLDEMVEIIKQNTQKVDGFICNAGGQRRYEPDHDK